jgi:hypothetical protein
MADVEARGAAQPAAPAVAVRSEAAAKQTRAAATWLAGAFAAIATILVAGSQLSDMGALESFSSRWWAAAVGLVVALVGALIAVLGALWILLPARSTVSDAAREKWFAKWIADHPEYLPDGVTSTEAFRGEWFRRRRESDDAWDAYEAARAAGGDIPAEVIAYRDLKSARWDEWEPWGHIVNAVATDRGFRRTAQRGFFAMFCGGTVAALGIAAFAWAAHPPDDEATAAGPAVEGAQAPVSVRLALTAEGKRVVRAASGCSAVGATAVRVGGKADTPDVLIVPSEGCRMARLTLGDALGEAIEGP